MDKIITVKLARGEYKGHAWWMWKDGDSFVVQMGVKLGRLGGIEYMAEHDSTYDGVLQKIKTRADTSIELYTRRWPNDPVGG